MDPRSLVTFPRTEAEYREWVEAHPHGFITNAWRAPGDRADNAMRWHQEGWNHIDPHCATETPPFFICQQRTAQSLLDEPRRARHLGQDTQRTAALLRRVPSGTGTRAVIAPYAAGNPSAAAPI
jgi:hypothetical protein